MEEVRHGTPVEALLWSVHDITQAVMHQLRPTLSEAGISWEQFLTLHIISVHRSATVSDMAQHLSISPPTACVSVDRLEAGGLVERRRSKSDQRTVEIRVTARGRRVERQVWSQFGRLTSQAAGNLPLHDIDAAAKVLRQLTDQLQRPGVEDAP